MQLLRSFVREDWQRLTQRMMTENAKLWRTIQGLVVLSSLAVFLITFLRLPRPWRDICQTVLSSCLFCAFPLWTAIRSQGYGYQRTFRAYVMLVAAAAVGHYTAPQPGETGWGFPSLWLTLLGSLAMLSSWAILARSRQQFPDQAERLGITAHEWPVNLLVGGVIGADLGAHLLLTTRFGGVGYLRISSWVAPLWHFCYQAGLRGLGEELLFRGVSFPLLCGSLHNSFWQATVKVTLVNLLIYLTPASPILNTEVGIWILPYLVAMVVINVGLRQWRQSLVPCLACNAAFNTALLAVRG